MEYKVEYKDSFEEGEDEQIIFDWTLHKPIKVKSVTGLVDDERSEIVIELTNGDVIELNAYHEISPYRKIGTTYRKDYTILRVKPNLSLDWFTYDVDDKYMDYLEKWTHVVYTTLVLYKEKMYAC